MTIGLSGVNQRKEPGYVLDNGLVLLESERDSQGNYKAGAGMEGMFLQTGRIFEPIRYPDGEILAFLECQPERTRAKDREAEKTSDTVKALEHREERGPKSRRPCGSSSAGRRRRVPCLGPVCRKGNGDRDGLAEGRTGNHHSF